MAYLTQAQAAVYSDAIAGLTQAKADALLAVASEQVDAFCNRTFDTVLEELPSSVAMAVALWAEDLMGGADAGRPKSSERIGDYSVSYAGMSADQIGYPCPDIVAGLLGPYRIIAVE